MYNSCQNFYVSYYNIKTIAGLKGTHGGEVGWGTELQDVRSRVPFSMVSQYLRPHYGPGVDLASDRNEYQEYFLWGKSDPVGRADNLTTFMCRLSWNLGSLNLLEPSGPVMKQYRDFLSFRTEIITQVSD
jgi:hypothetical protein